MVESKRNEAKTRTLEVGLKNQVAMRWFENRIDHSEMARKDVGTFVKTFDR